MTEIALRVLRSGLDRLFRGVVVPVVVDWQGTRRALNSIVILTFSAYLVDFSFADLQFCPLLVERTRARRWGDERSHIQDDHCEEDCLGCWAVGGGDGEDEGS